MLVGVLSKCVEARGANPQTGAPAPLAPNRFGPGGWRAQACGRFRARARFSWALVSKKAPGRAATPSSCPQRVTISRGRLQPRGRGRRRRPRLLGLAAPPPRGAPGVACGPGLPRATLALPYQAAAASSHPTRRRPPPSPAPARAPRNWPCARSTGRPLEPRRAAQPGPPSAWLPTGRPSKASLLLQLVLLAGVRFAVNLPGADTLRKQCPEILR